MTVEFEWTSGGCCVICKKPFEGMHLLSKKTCGNTCRQKLYRYGERIENVYWQMVDGLKFYQMTLDIDELNDKTIEKLEKLQQRISTILAETTKSTF